MRTDDNKKSIQGCSMNRLFRSDKGDLRWGWSAFLLIGGTILSGIILNIIIVITLTYLNVAQGMTRDAALEQANLQSSGFVPQTALSVLQMGVMFLLVRWLVTKMDNKFFSWAALGLGVAPFRNRFIIMGVGLAIGFTTLTLFLSLMIGTVQYLGTGFELTLASNVMVTLILGALLALATGFTEEIAFRGYLQQKISESTKPPLAVLISAALFAVAHPWGNTTNMLLYLASAFFVGILFGVLFLRTGFLWMGIALHTAWNYLQISILLIWNGADVRFAGAPLFIFEVVNDTGQMIIELCFILIMLAIVLWFFKPDVAT
jgi:uncharacterized protein